MLQKPLPNEMDASEGKYSRYWGTGWAGQGWARVLKWLGNFRTCNYTLQFTLSLNMKSFGSSLIPLKYESESKGGC
jgi:hypothetical protein